MNPKVKRLSLARLAETYELLHSCVPGSTRSLEHVAIMARRGQQQVLQAAIDLGLPLGRNKEASEFEGHQLAAIVRKLAETDQEPEG